MASNPKNKEKRIDKEIALLRNLKKEYKIGKKETQLGTLIDVSQINPIYPHLFVIVNSLKSIEVWSNRSLLTSQSSSLILIFCFVTNIHSNHQSSQHAQL